MDFPPKSESTDKDKLFIKNKYVWADTPGGFKEFGVAVKYLINGKEKVLYQKKRYTEKSFIM